MGRTIAEWRLCGGALADGDSHLLQLFEVGGGEGAVEEKEERDAQDQDDRPLAVEKQSSKLGEGHLEKSTESTEALNLSPCLQCGMEGKMKDIVGK